MALKPTASQGNGAGERLYLALDQGGHASRALVFDQHGGVRAKVLKEVAVQRPHPEWVEQDPEELVDSVRFVADQAVQALGTAATNLVSVGFATQRSTIVCWDTRTGAPLSPAISWQDRRAHAWLATLSRHAEDVRHSTGLRLSPHYGASKLRWCLDYLPEVAAASKGGYLGCGPLASFLLFRLLEPRAFLVDPANAGRSLLWNLEAQDWDKKLLALFGVPADCLPRCVRTRHTFGALRLKGKPTPVQIVTGDQSAAVFAYGWPQPATAYINIGTGAFAQRLSARRPEHSKLLSSLAYSDGAERVYTIEGTVNGAGSALAWLAQAQPGIGDIERQLFDWLKQKDEPPLFLNGVSGLGSPYWVPNFESRFIGDGAPWQRAVAVVESIVFLLQENLEALAAVDTPLSRIQVSGGLAAQDGLCQRLADLSRLPVYRPLEQEATARGLAYLLAGNPQAWSQAASGVWFHPEDNPALKARYLRWRAALAAAIAG